MMRTGTAAVMLLCGVILHGARAQAADGADVRVLLGFEKDEVARFGKVGGAKKKGPADEAGDQLLVKLPGWGGGTAFAIRKGDATEGEWAFVCSDAQKGAGSYAPGAYQRISNYRSSRRGSQPQDILNMCGISCDLPGGRDWSGCSRLWLDAKCDADAVIRLGIEDEEVMPPVERRFRIPAGKWVTVEVDLDKAREARGLDLSKMVNYYVFFEEAAGAGTLLLDNLRLAKGGARPALPLVVDEGTYEPEVRKYAIMQFPAMTGASMRYEELDGAQKPVRGQWKLMDFPADEPPPPKEKAGGETGREPWRIELVGKDGKYAQREPREKGGLTFVKWGILEPVAYDSRRIAVPLVADVLVHVFGTTDGGATWGPVAKPCPEWPVLDESPVSTLAGYRQDGCGGGASVAGDETYLLSNAGCCSWNWQSDRLFFNKVELTKDGWRLTPLAPVDGDMRHCTITPAVRRLASGRLWAAYDLPSRFRTCGVAAMYSDDGGASWQSWRKGKSAVLPGSLPVATDYGYGDDRVSLFPFGEGVACLICGTSKGNAYLWTCQDTTWGEAIAITGLKSPVMTALSPDGKTILLNTVGSGGGVYRFADGKCTAEQVKGYLNSKDGGRSTSYGYLSQCGDKVMLFGASEFGKTRQGGMTLPECRSILRWTRSPDGTWSEPVEVVREETPIGSFSCTRFATEAGVVLAWTCEGAGWVKVKIVAP